METGEYINLIKELQSISCLRPVSNCGKCDMSIRGNFFNGLMVNTFKLVRLRLDVRKLAYRITKHFFCDQLSLPLDSNFRKTAKAKIKTRNSILNVSGPDNPCIQIH